MPKIWRAKLHTEELTSCGFDRAQNDGQRWAIIEGLLKAKGLPECYLQDQTPFKCSEVEDGIMLEFDR